MERGFTIGVGFLYAHAHSRYNIAITYTNFYNSILYKLLANMYDPWQADSTGIFCNHPPQTMLSYTQGRERNTMLCYHIS